MKTFFYLLFLFSFSFSLNAQHCQTDQDWCLQRLLENKEFLKSNGLSEHQVDYYIPIVFQLVAGDNRRVPIDDQDAYNLLCQLNEYFNSGNITFYLKEPPIHIVNQVLSNDLAANSARAIIDVIKIDSAINFFVVRDIPSSGPGQTLSFTSVSGNWIGISKEAVVNSPNIVAHSLGHFFDLLDTDYGWTGWGPFEIPTWIKAPEEDLFGRPTEYMDGTNCEIGGDLVCDTPPEYYTGLFIAGCEYRDSLMDPACVPIEPIVNNIMSNYGDCNNYQFTQGQFDLIKTDLEINERGIYFHHTTTEIIGGAPSIPEPISPVNTTSPIVNNKVFFDWDDASVASIYTFQISENQNFSFPLQTISTSQSELYVEGLEPNQTYYWKVRVISVTGCNKNDSEIIEFSTTNLSSSKELKAEHLAFSISPNPVKGGILFGKFNTENSQMATIKLLSLDGKLLYQESFNFHQGGNNFSISTDNLPEGIFYIKMEMAESTISKKVMLIK